MHRLAMAMTVVILTYGVGAAAQNVEVPKRPKIGIALSGGAARGFAHIGVLQWLEENRIPIHCISGTSAGGLVGGMYATGISASEIRDRVAAIDWDVALRPEPPYSGLSHRRREDRLAYPFRFELGFRGGLTPPTGATSAQELGSILSRFSLPYSDLKSFDQLPIPFRCVATDMNTGSAVVLKDGSLSEALRATMAAPGAFTPICRNGTVLADGAMSNDLPTDVVRAMGADVVIAVDVSSPLERERSPNSLGGMLGRSIRVLALLNAQPNRRLADILITPDLKVSGDAAFSRCPSIVKSGHDAAAANGDALRKYAVDPREWEEYLESRANRVRSTEMKPDFVEITGVEAASARPIRELLSRHIGKPLNPSALEADLTTITGWGAYDSAAYERMVRGGQEGIGVRITRKQHGPPFIRPGIGMTADGTGELRVGLGARVIAMPEHAAGNEWRTDLNLGTGIHAGTEYYHRFSRRGWFVAPQIQYDHRARDIFRNRARAADYRTSQIGFGVDLGFEDSRKSEWRIGANVTNLRQTVRSGDPGIPLPDGQVRQIQAAWTHDSTDHAVIPRHGTRASALSRWVLHTPGASSGFAQIQASALNFAPVRKSDRVFWLASAGATVGAAAPIQHQYTLGGPLLLTGFSRDEFRGSHFVHAAGGYLRQLSSSQGFAPQRIYAGAWYELGGASEQFGSIPMHQSLSAGIVADTLIGAVVVGGTMAEGGQSRLFLSIGRFF